MKTKLLISTALVATAFCVNTTKAATLPENAANLTSGNYVVEDTGSANVHSGDIGLSGSASLTVKTYADVTSKEPGTYDEYNDDEDYDVDPSHAFRAEGNVTVKNGGKLTVERSDDKKTYMQIGEDLTIDGGTVNVTGHNQELLSTIEIGDFLDDKLSGITMTRGRLDLKNADVYTEGAINISGGTINADNTYLGSQDQPMTITGGTFTLKNGTVMESGNDAYRNQGTDMLIQNAIINATDSDIESTDAMFIKNSDIKIHTTQAVPDQEGAGVEYDDSFGIYSFGDISIQDSSIELKNSYIIGDQDSNITLSGSNNNVNLDNSTIKVDRFYDGYYSGSGQKLEGGTITVSGGTTTLKNESEIKAHDGSVLVNGGKLNLEDHSEVWAGKTTVSDSAVINIKNSEFGGDDELYIEGGEISATESIIGADDKVEISGGKISISNPNLRIDDEDIDMPEGEHMAGSYVGIFTDNLLISGGETTLNASIRGINSVNMTGGTLTLNTTQREHASTLWSAGDITLSGGTINLNGMSVPEDTDGSNITNFLLTDSQDYVPGNVDISGTTINVSGYNNMIGTSGNLSMTDSVLNIQENSSLDLYAEMNEDGHVDENSKRATLNLNGGTINLSGMLFGNIDGNDRGVINFESANAVIYGGVESPSLTFNKSHSLSNAITGTIGSLDKLTLNRGTLTFDKEPTGTITTVDVANGATLDIGLNTLHSTGDKADGEGVFLRDNSTLKFTATSADVHGQVKANYVNISENGTTLYMTFNGAALSKGDSMTLKLFDQSEDEEGVEIEGKFATLANNARYSFTDEGNGYYKITGEKSASDVIDDNPSEGGNGNTSGNQSTGGNGNTSGNQSTGGNNDKPDTPSQNTINVKSTAEAWDHLDISTTKNAVTVAVVNKLAELSNKATTKAAKQAYINALTALAPETAPAIQSSQMQISNQVFNAVGTRLSGGNHSGFHRGMSSGDNYTDMAVWVQGLYNKAELDNTKKAKGFDSKTYGTAMGIEGNVDEEIKLGLGYAYSKTDIDGFLRDTDAKTHTALVYGEYRPNNWYINTVASYGWSDYDEKKDVDGVNVKANWDVETFGLQTMTGYEIYSRAADLKLTPEAGVRYIHIKNKAYTDSAGQKVKTDDSDILTGVLGLNFARNYRIIHTDIRLKPEVRVAMTYDLLNDNAKSTVTLPNNVVYSTSGKSLDRFGIELGFGVTSELNDNVELSLNYEGKFRKDYKDHTALINAKYKF